MMENNDTIAAIATGLTPSGIGIVRISGKEALRIADQISGSKSGKSLNLADTPTHTIHYGFIYDGEKTIDECLFSVMRAPRSFTTEDTVEINCHGGPYVLSRVLDIVIKNGARLAEPGEFTKRAFLNGRIDLTEAESVIDIISSKNEFARDIAIRNLKGSTYEKIRLLREKILKSTAFIEAAIDDPEHYSLDGFGDFLLSEMDSMILEIEAIIRDSENGILLKEGINTVVVGKPNVGKSTLFNRLLGRDKAIVTEIAGTTRDILDAEINLNGITLNIYDTAGIHDTEDQVERIGVLKAKELLGRSDLIIFMVDSSKALDLEDESLIREVAASQKKAIVLFNKSDLKPEISDEELKGKFEEGGYNGTLSENVRYLHISASTGDGVEKIHEVVREYFFSGNLRFNQEVIITNKRQLYSLGKCLKSLRNVQESIGNGISEEFYTIDLMDAYEELGMIIGETLEDDLADKIFSEFCMGK